jgi:hypothetical protein
MQQLHKYTTVLEPLLRNDPRAAMEVLSEAVFLCGPLRGTRPTGLGSATTLVETGSNTAVALSVIGGEENGTQCLGG